MNYKLFLSDKINQMNLFKAEKDLSTHGVPRKRKRKKFLESRKHQQELVSEGREKGDPRQSDTCVDNEDVAGNICRGVMHQETNN